MRLTEDLGYQINGLDLSGDDQLGTDWLVLALDGWDSLPPASGEVFDREFSDGGWITPAYYEPLTLRLSGRMYSVDRPSANSAIRRFNRALPMKGLASVVVQEDGTTTHRWVRVSGVPVIERPTDKYVTFDVTLIAPDPRRLSGDGSAPYQFSSTAFLPSATGGLQLPGAQLLRTNQCTNPGAEVSIAGWTQQLLTATSDSAWAASGSKSFKLTGGSSPSSDMRAGNAASFPFGMQPGKTYTVSATMRLATPMLGAYNDRVRRVNILYSTDGSSYTFAYGSQGPNVAGEFRSSVTAAIPANATGVLILVGLGSATAADTIWWDDILVEESPTALPYFDGNTTNTGSRSYAWTGASGLSTSSESTVAGLQVPFSIGATVVNGTVTVETTGDATPPVLVRINGPAVQPIIRDQDGGAMPLDISLDAGQWLDVDLDARTIKINSTVNRRNLLRGPWIQPRSGMILSLDAAVYNPLTSMTVFWTDASY